MIVNLAYPEKSELKYEWITFPDGQKHFKCEPFDPLPGTVEFRVRLKSYEDIILLLLAQDAVLAPWNYISNQPLIRTFISWMVGARCDRRFTPTESEDAQVILSLLEHMVRGQIDILDPHFGGYDSKCFFSVTILSSYIKHVISQAGKNRLVVFPDLGARLRYRRHILDEKIMCLEKTRSPSGRIEKVVIPNGDSLPISASCVVVDDICDGGATFIETAKVLKAGGARKLYLYVTHGLFTKGVEPLLQWYEKIYTTNSYQDINHPSVEVVGVI